MSLSKPTIQDDHSIDLPDLSRLTGVPHRTLQDWKKKAGWPASTEIGPEGNLRYPIGPAIRNILLSLKGKQKPATTRKENDVFLRMADAKANLVEAQAKREALKYLRESGAAIPLEEAIATLVRANRTIRQSFDNSPTRWAANLAGMDDPLEIKEYLEAEFARIFEEMRDGF